MFRALTLPLGALVLLAGCDVTPTDVHREPTSARRTSGPLTVTLAGPSTVAQDVSCTWQATVTGGTEPYTYYWHTLYWQDFGGSSDSSFTTSFGGEGPEVVGVTVEDVFGNRVNVDKGIYVTHVYRSC